MSWREARKRQQCTRDLTQEKYFPKDLEKRRGAGFHEFLQWVSKTSILEIHGVAGVEPGRCSSVPVEKEGR